MKKCKKMENQKDENFQYFQLQPSTSEKYTANSKIDKQKIDTVRLKCSFLKVFFTKKKFF